MPPSRLKVLMTTDAVGGIWVFTTTLATALARRGDQVHLIVLGPEPSNQQLDAIRGTEGIQLELTDFALEWLDPAGKDRERTIAGLAAIHARVRPDVVHLNSFREAAAEWGTPVLVTAHSCAWSWRIACRGSRPPEPCWTAYANNVASGLAAATRWIAPTAALREQIQAIYGPPSIGQVIWNGVDPLEPGDKEPMVLAAGRLWDEAKNISALAAIAADLQWPIAIAGPVRSEPGSHAAAFRSASLSMLGEISRADLLACMQRSAIFAAPALYEPFGLAVLEAASAGCALLLSDIPTFRELWTGAAMFVDPRDTHSIRSGLQRLCQDAILRCNLQRAARRRARRYSLAATARTYRDAYYVLGALSPTRSTAGILPAGVCA